MSSERIEVMHSFKVHLFKEQLFNTEHTKDSDCTLDNNHTCIGCGVYHGEPCPVCKQRGYHKTDCSLSDANNGCSKCALFNVECLNGSKHIPLMQLYDEPECENFKPIK